LKSAQYKFFTPTRILFGEGCSGDAGKWAKEMGGTRALLVTDRGLEKTGIVDTVRVNLEEQSITVLIYDGVQENPSTANVHEGRDLIRERKIDILVALGGGSPMDAAKAMAILSAHEGSIVEYEFGLKPFTSSGPPVIAIPTTAGTGSEATMGSVITDTQTHRKFDVVDPRMAPRLSLVDPVLTLSLPPSLTAATGMDALTHAIEGYTATLASPLTDALHRKAIELLGGYLVRAFRDGSDREARSQVMMAALTAGVGFPNSGLGAVHGLSMPLGGHFGIPHGIANAIMLPHVMRFNLSARPEKFTDIAVALGADEAVSEDALRMVIALRRTLQIPLLSSYDIQQTDLPKLARDALGRNSNCVTNPRTMTQNEAVEVYLHALRENGDAG